MEMIARSVPRPPGPDNSRVIGPPPRYLAYAIKSKGGPNTHSMELGAPPAAGNLYVRLAREKRLDVDDWRAVDDLDRSDL